jgi:hypothetical protein
MSDVSKVRLTAEQLEGRDVPSAAPIFTVNAGAGLPPRVQVFNVSTGARLADFLAFENTFTGGVNTAVGDVNGDNVADLIVGAGVGGGPRVRVIDGRSLTPTVNFPRAPLNGSAQISDALVIADFFAFEDTQRGGTFVATGNFIGSTNAELVIGAGPGGGPRVRILDGAQVSAQGRAFTSNGNFDTVANFFAFESTFRNGVTVAAAPTPLGGLQFSDLVVAPGLGGGPRVRVLNGAAIADRQLLYTSFNLNEVRADFFARDPNTRSGLFVTAGDFNRDGFADVGVGTGPGVTGNFTVYSGAAIQQGNFVGTRAGDILDQLTFNNYTRGVTVGAAVIPNGVNNAFLITGTAAGGQAQLGRAVVSQFVFGAGFLQRQAVFTINFDDTYTGLPFVSQ